MRIGMYHMVKWSLVVFVAHTVNSQTNYDNYNRDNNNRDANDPYGRTQQYGQDQYNRNGTTGAYDPYNNSDPYNRNNNNDPNNRGFNRSNDPYNRSNDPYNKNNDPYNRNNSNDPYNRNNDPYNRSNDPYNRSNDPNRPRDPNDPYNRNFDPNRPNDPYNRNNDPNRPRDPNDPYSRNNDPNRPRDPNDPYNRNDPNRSRDPNDPYNRNFDPNRPNDPYNKNSNDPYNNNNRDPYNKNPTDNRYGQNDRNNYGGSGSNYGGGNRFADDGTCCEEYCYDIDEQPYVKLSSKTPYQFAYGKTSNQHIVPQCKPVQFWGLLREGTSVPDRMSVERYKALQKIHDEFVRNYEERSSFPSKGRLCAGDYDNLKRWRWNDTFSEHNAGSLTQQGSDDLKFLARRYQTRLRELLVPYNENHYYFQYTDGDKSHDSYQAYVQGLFGNDASRVHASVRSSPGGGGYSDSNNRNSDSYNPFNSFANNENSYQSQSQYGGGGGGAYSSQSKCKSFQQRADEQRETSVEYQAFKQKQDYKDMVRNVFKRLGFRYSLNDSIVEDMYDVCRYEKSWYVNRPSPWCGAFTKEQLKLLEYGEDLFNYYKSGYGHEHLNKNLGCGMMKDMYDRFERTVNGATNEQKVIMHFRDLDTILKTMVALDIGRDQSTLTADNYYQLTSRQWRLSNLAPFSGNLAAILYQCDSQQSNDKFKVMFFMNENPVDFPACSVGLCSWQMIREKFQLAAQECRLDWCERGSANLNGVSNLSLLLSAVTIALYKLVL